MRDRGERRECTKLGLVEHVVELRWATTARTGGAVGPIVPEQLQERIVDDVGATNARRREKRISSLRRRQRSITPPLGHEREQIVEEREVRYRIDLAIGIPITHQRVDGFVVSHSRLRVANVVELHDVARGEYLAGEAANVTGFEGKSFADFTAIGEVQAVVVRRSDALVQGSLDTLIFVCRNCQREVQRSRNWTTRAWEGQRADVRIETAELRSQLTVDHIKR